MIRIRQDPFMLSLAETLQRALPNVAFGPVARSRVGETTVFSNRAVDLALTPASDAYFRYLDDIQRRVPIDDQVRAISALHITPLLVAVRPQSAIRTVSDLHGHAATRILFLPPGELSQAEIEEATRRERSRRLQLGERPGTDRLIELLLNAFDIDRLPAQSLQVLAPTDALERFTTGSLDAIWGTGYFTGDVIHEAAARGARLLSIEGTAVERLRKDYPFIRPMVIPRNTYPGQAEPVRTIGVDLLLVCRASLDQSLVHTLTTHYIASLQELTARHRTLQLIDLELAPASPIPLHDGAARYYRESELFR